MKKTLAILLLLVGFGVGANAQKKVAFYSGKEYVVMYSDGTVGYWDGNQNYNGRWSGDRPYIYNSFGKTGCRIDNVKILLLDSNGKRIEWNRVTLYGFNTDIWAIQSPPGTQIRLDIPNKGQFNYK